MNKKNLLSIASFTLMGLIVGYAVFGKWGEGYVNLKTLLALDNNLFQDAFSRISGIEEMRTKILLCGLGGAVLGVLATIRFKRK